MPDWLGPQTDLGWFVLGALAPGIARDLWRAARWTARHLPSNRRRTNPHE